jgi:hypothetical protein
MGTVEDTGTEKHRITRLRRERDLFGMCVVPDIRLRIGVKTEV